MPRRLGHPHRMAAPLPLAKLDVEPDRDADVAPGGGLGTNGAGSDSDFSDFALPCAAQSGVFLQVFNNLHEIIQPDDALKLETGLAVGHPDQMCLDAANHRQAHDQALAAIKPCRFGGHEAVCGNVGDVQMDIAEPAVFADDAMIDWMPRRAPQVSNG